MLHHIALGAREPEALASFYAQVFGLHEVARVLPQVALHRDAAAVRSVGDPVKKPIWALQVGLRRAHPCPAQEEQEERRSHGFLL